MVAFSGIFYTFKETFPRYPDQFLCFFTDFPDAVGTRGVGVIAFVDHTCVQTDDVSFPDKMMRAWDPVHHLVVDGYAD